MVDSNSRILSSAKSFFFGTFISRVGGLVRDMSMAFFFGASPQIASFIIAYRFANLFRRLLGESTMNLGFIPHFEAMKRENEVKASFFYRDFFFSMIILLVALVLILQTILTLLPQNSFSGSFYLAKLMMPGLFFICLYGLNSAFLQCYRYYFLPAFAPFLFNLFWIISLFFLKDVKVLAIVVVLSFFAQWLFPFVKSHRLVSRNLTISDWFKPKIFSSDVKMLFKSIGFAVVGIGAVQINSALDPCFVYYADHSGPAYLWYAMRLQQMPIALFGLSISGALLPPLVRAVKDNDKARFQLFFSDAMRKSWALMFATLCGIFALADVTINLIFAHGAFSHASLVETSYCLFGYALALPFISFILIFSNSFYAKREYKLPMVAAIYSVGVNIFCNCLFVFVFHWPSYSVALATSISAFFQTTFLYIVLCRREKKHFFTKQDVNSFLSAFVTSVGACIVTLVIKAFFIRALATTLLMKFQQFSFLFFVFLITLVLFAKLFKAKDMIEIISIKRLGKKQKSS